MAVEKKRSASAALMDLSSSEDEEPPSMPRAALDATPAPRKRTRPGTTVYRPPEHMPPVGVVKPPAGAQPDVEIIDVGEGVLDVDSESSGDSDSDDAASVAAGKDEDDSEGSDGEIEEDPPGADSDGANDASVARAVTSGGKDVAQHSARYFMMDNVVCSHCGVKGHLSFDCPEEPEARRCFLCGKPGHNSRACPDEACFYCGKAGHRQRDCPTKTRDRTRGASGPRPRHTRFGREVRRLAPPHATRLVCYVCGEDGHVDCSLVKSPRAVLSCCNCGAAGHAGNGCHEPPAERWVTHVNDVMRERRDGKGRGEGRKGSRAGRGGGGCTCTSTVFWSTVLAFPST
jgi:transcription elongation factor Elf1